MVSPMMNAKKELFILVVISAVVGVSVIAGAAVTTGEMDFAAAAANRGYCDESLKYASGITEPEARYAALVKVGMCFNRKGDYPKAVSAFISAYNTDHSKDLAQSLMALAYFKAGDYSEARTWIENALERKGPNYHRALLIASIIYERLNMLDELRRVAAELSRAPNKKLRSSGSRILKMVKKREQKWFGWVVAGRSGVMFDFNPGLSPGDSTGSEKRIKDAMGYLAASGRVYSDRWRVFMPTFTYRLYQNVHTKADKYNFQVHDVSLHVKSVIKDTHVHVWGGYFSSFYEMSLNHYSEGGYIQGRVRVLFPHWGYILGAGMKRTAFYEDVPLPSLDRDATQYFLEVGGELRFLNELVKLSVLNSLTSNAAEQDQWSYTADRLALEFSGSFFNKRLDLVTGVVGEVRFFLKDSIFLGVGDSRLDLEYGMDFKVKYHLKPWLHVAGTFTLRRSDSNVSLYDYIRYLAGAEVGFAYF